MVRAFSAYSSGEQERPDVVRDAENEPVRDPVDVRVLADAQHPAVPRGHERDDERRQREPAAGQQEVLVAALPAARRAQTQDERRRQVGADDGEIERARAFLSRRDA